MSNESLQPITQEDIAAFSKTLADWGKTLPPKDSAILQLMLDQPEGKEEELSDKALQGVTGGARRVANSRFLGSTTLAAHGTSKKTDVVTNNPAGPSWDTDSEWDYSPH
jgi:hypothetical protein